jgi:hypothetical protein
MRIDASTLRRWLDMVYAVKSPYMPTDGLIIVKEEALERELEEAWRDALRDEARACVLLAEASQVPTMTESLAKCETLVKELETTMCKECGKPLGVHLLTLGSSTDHRLVCP